MFVYLVLLMTGFNFMRLVLGIFQAVVLANNITSHGSQDLYPTMLSNQYLFSVDAVTVTQVVANLGALTGGTTIGYCSQIAGRRLSIMVMCIIGGALLYPYTFVGSKSVMAAAFFEQFCVQGAWGVIPIHLLELSPGTFRAFMVGTVYQLGNLVSSASTTIEATIGERYPLAPIQKNGKTVKRYNYGKVICILMGAVYAYTLLMTFIGPEHRANDISVYVDREKGLVSDEDPSRRVDDEQLKKGGNDVISAEKQNIHHQEVV